MKVFPEKPASRQRGVLATDPPRPWPVDPALSRRVIETRKRIAQTRRELKRHVLSERRRGESGT